MPNEMKKAFAVVMSTDESRYFYTEYFKTKAEALRRQELQKKRARNEGGWGSSIVLLCLIPNEQSYDSDGA